MKRRTFLAGLGSAAAACALRARADERIPRIGFLGPASADADRPALEAFEAGLADLGYVPGKTIEIESRFADGDEPRMAEMARELVDLKVEVIVTIATGVFAARRATNTVPIVSAAGPPLVEMGLAESFGHPGGNVTGETFFLDELQVKRLSFLKQVKPSTSSVGLLVPRGFVFLPSLRRVLDAPVKALGLVVEPIEADGPDDCDRALSTAPGASIGGLLVLDAPAFVVGAGPAVVAAAALKRGLPAAGALSIAKNGGLLGYGVDFFPMFRRAAVFVDKILKGTKPGDIPIEQATKFITIVNLKTAKALGLDIPPTLLAAADEVIE